MTLRDTMRRHAVGPLTRADHFGEEVTYVFKDGSPDRTVRAVVNRLDREPAAPGAMQVAKVRAIVVIPRDGDVGILTIDPGDKLSIAMRLGEEPAAARIIRIVSQDEGAFELEVEA